MFSATVSSCDNVLPLFVDNVFYSLDTPNLHNSNGYLKFGEIKDGCCDGHKTPLFAIGHRNMIFTSSAL